MMKLQFVGLLLFLGGMLLSCSASKQGMETFELNTGMEQSISGLTTSKKENSTSDAESIERKIIFSAFVSLVVHIPDSANVHIEKIAKKYDGYINEVGTYRTIIRVESEHLKSAISDLSKLGKINSKNIKGQDVTESYYDFMIRLENAKKSREKYLELLAKAENVEAALMVEKELERLNETIDLIKGKMNRINHLSAYSTITISLKEKRKPGMLGYIGIGLYHSIKWLFVRN